MASVRLGRYEVEERHLPAVCMKCGAEATVHRKRTFSWYPSWIVILLLAGLLPYIIVALILTKRMTVHVPLCEPHKRHWFWRAWFIGGGFVLFLILGIGAMAVLINQGNRPGGTDQLGGILCGATVLGLLIWLIAAVIVQNTAIRPIEITDRTITLTHVAPAFVEAVGQVRMTSPGDEDD